MLCLNRIEKVLLISRSLCERACPQASGLFVDLSEEVSDIEVIYSALSC